jgi:hypothetical protein
MLLQLAKSLSPPWIRPFSFEGQFGFVIIASQLNSFNIVKLKTNATIRLVLFLSSCVLNSVICMHDMLNVTTKFI